MTKDAVFWAVNGAVYLAVRSAVSRDVSWAVLFAVGYSAYRHGNGAVGDAVALAVYRADKEINRG